MNIDEMKHELVTLGGGAHALASHILGNPDDAFIRGAESYIKKNLFWDWAGALEAIDRAYQLAVPWRR